MCCEPLSTGTQIRPIGHADRLHVPGCWTPISLVLSARTLGHGTPHGVRDLMEYITVSWRGRGCFGSRKSARISEGFDGVRCRMIGTDSDARHLRRLMAVLGQICDGTGQISFRELSQEVELPISTTHRLVGLLTSAGLCARRLDGRLVPGVQLVELGLRAMHQMQPPQTCQQLLLQLAHRTDESASFSLLAGGTIVVVARVEGERPHSELSQVGDILPPHRTAIGKAILARLPGDDRARMLHRSAGSEAPELAERLGPGLARAGEDGYVFEAGEFSLGLCCLAAPVLDGKGQVIGGISVSGPSSRLTPPMATAWIPSIREVSELFSQAMAAA